MKIRATGVAVVSAMILAACASATGSPTSSGSGGHTTTTVSHSASSSGAATGGSTAGPSCSAPAGDSDCATCADFATCETCEEGLHAQGAMLFNALIDCVFCTACYTVCEGATNGCTMPPAMKDACDTGTPSAPGAGTTCGNGMGGCVACSQKTGGSCNAANMACGSSADCKAFNTALQACPQN